MWAPGWTVHNNAMGMFMTDKLCTLIIDSSSNVERSMVFRSMQCRKN